MLLKQIKEYQSGLTNINNKANEIAAHYKKAFIPNQFSNFDNAKAHEVTAQEILKDSENNVDIVSARRNKNTLAYEISNRWETLLVDQEKSFSLTEIIDEPTPTSKQEIIINLGNNSCVVEYDGQFKIKGGE